MKDIVFALTRYNYDSYTDYRRLIEVSGFNTCFIDEIDISQDVIYIISPINGEFRPHIDNEKAKKNKQCKVIWWNLERPIEVDPNELNQNNGVYASTFQKMDFLDSYVDYIWISDRNLVQCINKAGIDKVRFVPVGSHAKLRLTYLQNANALYKDAIHLMYLTPRRQTIVDQLKKAKVKFADNTFTSESKDYLLNTSKIMLNVHQTDHKIIEPLRLALAATYQLPYVTEESIDTYPFEQGYDIIESPYETLIENTLYILNHYQNYLNAGMNLHYVATGKFSFPNNVNRGVEDVLQS